MAGLVPHDPSMILFYNKYVILVQFQASKHWSRALSDSVKIQICKRKASNNVGTDLNVFRFTFAGWIP
jgi:hypothetical protein